MALKQKQFGGDDAADKQKSKIGDDPAAMTAVEKAKDILADLDKLAKKKKGHWEFCCGVKRWVED